MPVPTPDHRGEPISYSVGMGLAFGSKISDQLGLIQRLIFVPGAGPTPIRYLIVFRSLS